MSNLDMFRENRERLLEQMDDGVLIMKGAGELLRNSDINFKFRQHSNFHYLTGLGEANAYIALEKKGRKSRLTIFLLPKDAFMEMWLGKRIGLTGAKKVFGARDAFPVDEFNSKVRDLMVNQPRLYLDLQENGDFAADMVKRLAGFCQRPGREGHTFPENVINAGTLLAEMRLRKTTEQIESHRRSAGITALGYKRLVDELKPGIRECNLEAALQYEFIRNGGTWAYEIIVAGGTNALTLHYIKNDEELRAGDLVLIDAGGELDYCDTDVSRTYPVSGKFTRAQKQIYNAVLKAQKKAIAVVKPGNTIKDVDDAATRVLAEEMIRLGLLAGPIKKVMSKEKYKAFYPHSTSHWLGMDTHDVGNYRRGDQWQVLEPGMILTVEPGLYIPEGKKGVPRQFAGIGVRIEDDILVTETGHENLTEAIPKEVAEIEKIMAARPKSTLRK